MVHNFFTPRILHNSLMMLLIKLAPPSLRSLAGSLKIEMSPCYSNLVMALAVWSGTTYTTTCFVKWSWNTRMLVALGGLLNSIVISMLVKPMCKRTNGVVATIGCRGTLDTLPSCCKQCTQDLMDCCIWLFIPGQQKCSCNKDRVRSQPWWPASLWQPFKGVTQCALGTKKSRISLVSPLGIEHRYKAPW